MNHRKPGHDPKPEASYSRTIPVVNEELKVEKESRSSKVTLKKEVYEEEIPFDTTSFNEHVNIDRKPINQEIKTAPPGIRHEGDTMIIPVLREEVVVKKRLVLVEELHVTRKKEEIKSTENVTLRKEKVIVERENLSDDTDSFSKGSGHDVGRMD
ncbi:MAG: DUF2382 domain-containing protein [Cyclobacteriaceae bacterium]